MPQQSPVTITRENAQASASVNSAIKALDLQRSELDKQLMSLTIRRDLLNQQLANADGPGQAQLHAEIKAVGDRSAQVMKQLAAVDDAVNKALADAAAGKAVEAQGGGRTVISFPPPASNDIPAFAQRAGILSVAVIAIIAVVAVATRLRRPVFRGTALSDSDVARLERLQQAVDVIAVEVERISESQRYLTKAIGAGPAVPVGAPERERAPGSRS